MRGRRRISRREFLAAFPAIQTRLAAGKGQQYPSEARKFPDSLTEREVWRLTGPSRSFHHPAEFQKFIARNNSFALLGGSLAGDPQVFRVELPRGRLIQLTSGTGIDTYSIYLAPDDQTAFFLQGGALKQIVLRNLREREIYRIEDGWAATEMNISIDGRYAALAEMRASDRVDAGSEDTVRKQWERKPLCRIRIVETFKGKSWIVAEERAWLGRPQLRPKRDQVLYCYKGPLEELASRMWLVNLDGKQKISVRPRKGDEELGPEYWTGDGKLIGYAYYANRTRNKATVHTFDPESREEQIVANCTQFWYLRGNSDNSALVGASRSKAGPNIYVLFAVTERELTVCEHAATGPGDAEPRPVFSPDSQWVWFTSDREKSPAVYRASVSDLVEKTS